MLGHQTARVSSRVGSCEKACELCTIEVEHLRTRELAVAEQVEAEDGRVTSLAGRRDTPLMPKHDDLVVASRHDARVHALLGLGGLQRNPGFGPRRTGGRLQGRYTTVRQRRRPVKLGGWIGQGDQLSQVAVLDRTEYLAHGLDVLLRSHGSLP